ncbi:MAG: hypothetical protein ABFS45_07145 [Pseudomonadota bacterium]
MFRRDQDHLLEVIDDQYLVSGNRGDAFRHEPLGQEGYLNQLAGVRVPAREYQLLLSVALGAQQDVLRLRLWTPWQRIRLSAGQCF